MLVRRAECVRCARKQQQNARTRVPALFDGGAATAVTPLRALPACAERLYGRPSAENDEIHCTSSTQNLREHQTLISEVLGVPMHKVSNPRWPLPRARNTRTSRAAERALLIFFNARTTCAAGGVQGEAPWRWLRREGVAERRHRLRRLGARAAAAPPPSCALAI